MATVEDDKANDLEWLENVDSYIQKLGNISLKSAEDLTSFTKESNADLLGFLDRITNDIDRPIFKSLAKDMIGVFGSFYIDDEALCCLVKNIMRQMDISTKLNDYLNEITKIEFDGMYVNDDNFELVFAETKFGKAVNGTIAIIDVVLVFLEMDISDFMLPILDFMRELSEAIIGFMCLAFQEIIFTVRDSAIDWIIGQIDALSTDESWMECLPYMDFISVLKKYISDYGLVDKLLSLIEGFLANAYNKFKGALDAELPKNVKLIKLLRLIRKILVSLKDAVINWEFCSFINDSGDGNENGDNNDDNSDSPSTNYLNRILNKKDKGINNYSFMFTDDNTILNNSNNTSNGDDSGNNGSGNLFNQELKAFLQNYMGFSADRADAVVNNNNGLNTGDNDGNKSGACGTVLKDSDLSSILDKIISTHRNG